MKSLVLFFGILLVMGCSSNHDNIPATNTDYPVFTLAWSEYPSWSVFGVAQDTTDKDLTAAREARLGARARSKVAGELAGADAKSAESEFIQFAQNTHASSEFDALIGLEGTKNPTEAAKLPES